jgi:hypothetical protein
MEAVEFQTRVKNGTIQIPEKYKAQFENHVRVVLMREEQTESQVAPKRKFGSAKGEVWMSKNFDEPLDDIFKDYGPTE